MGSPVAPMRAPKRDAWISINATRPWGSALVRRELGQDASETERVVAQRRSHPVVARRRRVAFVEDEVDDLEDGRQSRRELGPARDFERDLLFGERPLGPDDSLRDRRFGHEERARDLVGREAAENAEGQRDARLARQNWMTAREDEAKQIVADVVVDRRVEIRRGRASFDLDLVTYLLTFAFERLLAANRVDRAVFRDRHQPRAWILGHARLRPTLQRRDERVLRQLLGDPYVTHDAREPGYEARRLDPPDRVDGAMGCRSAHDVTSRASSSTRRARHPRRRRASRRRRFAPSRGACRRARAPSSRPRRP